MAPVLGYWNVRGIAEPLRYLLHYLGVEFEDKRYDFRSDDFMDNDWNQKDKQALGLTFPKIPYYIDGELKLTQSGVIMRHLARKHGGFFFPDPRNEDEILKYEMLEDHVRDMMMELEFLAYNSQMNELKVFFGQRFKTMASWTSQFLGTKQWLMGEKISVTDFQLFETLDVSQYYHGEVWKEFQNLVEFSERFASLPGVKEYRKTSMKWPIQPPFATFGYKGDPPKV